MNTFIRKIDAERKVLGVVNAVTAGPGQLAGLSSGAIESWRRRATIHGADEISGRLIRIAGLCRLLSNRSHESFNTLDPALMERIEDELAALGGLLAGADAAAGGEPG